MEKSNKLHRNNQGANECRDYVSQRMAETANPEWDIELSSDSLARKFGISRTGAYSLRREFGLRRKFGPAKRTNTRAATKRNKSKDVEGWILVGYITSATLLFVLGVLCTCLVIHLCGGVQ